MTETIDAQAHEEGSNKVRTATDSATGDNKTMRRVLWFTAIIVMLLLVRSFVAEPARVRGDSMQPTYPAGAVVVLDKLTLVAREPRRGDVIVTNDPRTGASIIKRVVAIEGDSVGIENGVLVLNGLTVVEGYVDNHDMEGYYFGPDIVPDGTVFVLGDNRADSVDSRAFGPIAVERIDGRVLTKIWPLG